MDYREKLSRNPYPECGLDQKKEFVKKYVSKSEGIWGQACNIAIRKLPSIMTSLHLRI
jgi:hypothetical protein